MRREAEKLEAWVTNNVNGAPPFTVGGTVADAATLGKQDPGSVESESYERARTFAMAASRDVTAWLLGRGGRARSAANRSSC
jgi:hypothetical protein